MTKLTRIVIEFQVHADDDDSELRVVTQLARIAASRVLEENGMEPIHTDTRVIEETYNGTHSGCVMIAPPRVIVDGYAGID